MAKGRKRKKFDASKNRKLDEFLSRLEIEEGKKEQIIEFVENLAFEKLKEASIKQQKTFLRLKR